MSELRFSAAEQKKYKESLRESGPAGAGSPRQLGQIRTLDCCRCKCADETRIGACHRCYAVNGKICERDFQGAQ